MMNPPNQSSERSEKRISKLESLKVFLQSEYTRMILFALLSGTGMALTTKSGSSIPQKNNDIATIPQDKNDSLTTEKLSEFGHFLEQQQLGTIDRTTTLGRYVRICRYSDHIQQSADKHGIPFEYLFALIMVESQGNTASINEKDGGAGFIHFQPDVAKQFGLKVFTDAPEYGQYDVATMKKQGKTLHQIYKIHGRLLKKIIKGKSMTALENLDERFNITKCIETTAQYLADIKKNVDDKKDDVCKDASWNSYKNDVEYDFDRMLALNGFNKGPNRFSAGFEDGSHIKNIKKNLKDMRQYDEYVKHMLQKGASDQEIFAGLQTTKFL